MNYEVKHLPEQSRFELVMEGKTAHADYHLSGNIMTIFHVYTPPEFRGKGIAAQVAKYALDYIRNNNLKIVPQCPYMRDYMNKHSEYQSLVVT
jgi:uncharacterized protein